MSLKILFIRLSSIGDIVLTSPAIRCMKNQVPDAEIHFLTKKEYSYIIKANPHVIKVHEYKDNMSDLLKSLKAEKFDWIIDLHNNVRSLKIKSCLKAKHITVRKYNLKKFLLVQCKIDRLPISGIAERNLATLEPLKVKYDGQGLDFFIPENEVYQSKDLPKFFQNGFVAFVIGGKHTTKKLPIEKVIEACKRIDYPVMLLGGREESADGEYAMSQSKGNILNLVGRLSLFQSASLIREARLVVTNDTGLMHIAAAFGKKILSIWGNTTPRFGFAPYEAHPDSSILEVENLSCRPCSKLGFTKCPKKHFKCMNEISIDRMVDWINTNY